MTVENETLTGLVVANIKRKRKLLGLSQEELAEMVDIGQQSLSRMEKGRIAPRFERLQIIADALHCSVPELFRKHDEGMCAQAEILVEILNPLSPVAQQSLISMMTLMAQEIRKLDHTPS